MAVTIYNSCIAEILHAKLQVTIKVHVKTESENVRVLPKHTLLFI